MMGSLGRGQIRDSVWKVHPIFVYLFIYLSSDTGGRLWREYNLRWMSA